MPYHPPASRHHGAIPSRRWVMVALRTLHVVAVIALGSTLLGAPAAQVRTAAGLTLLSGLAMFALDLAGRPSHWREVAGLAVVVKLILSGWMAAQPGLATLLFWTIVVISSVISHAPKGFRHRVLLGRG